MKIENRLLFLKYALPCAGTLVMRGNVPQEYVDHLVQLVSKGKVPEEDAESMFKVANAMCEFIAKRSGKETIDDDVIRQYFLMEHSRTVDDRFELMKDFDPVDCKTYACKVVEADGDSALLETPLGKRTYKTIFERDVKPGDNVVVHWGFIVERIPESLARKMEEKRKSYEKGK